MAGRRAARPREPGRIAVRPRGAPRRLHRAGAGPAQPLPARAARRATSSSPAGSAITPILPMIEAAEARGADWQPALRRPGAGSMAFLDELERYGDRVTVWPQDEQGHARPRLGPVASRARTRSSTAAGPKGCSSAVEEACAGWPEGSLHIERFSAKELEELRPTRSNIRGRVPALGRDRDRGRRPDDLRGRRGGRRRRARIVHGGRLRHVRMRRDRRRAPTIATRSCPRPRRERGDMIMICVSRSRSERLVLDI